MRYWVCQSCKWGQVDEYQPTKCLNCGEVGGKWKSSDASNMMSFRMYECSNCHCRTVQERQPPTYPCDMCGSISWHVFKEL